MRPALQHTHTITCFLPLNERHNVPLSTHLAVVHSKFQNFPTYFTQSELDGELQLGYSVGHYRKQPRVYSQYSQSAYGMI